MAELVLSNSLKPAERHFLKVTRPNEKIYRHLLAKQITFAA